MAELVLYTTDQVRDTYLRDFKLRLPGASTARGTAPYVDAVTVAGVAPALYKNASIAADRQLISKTFGTELETLAADRNRPKLQGSGSVASVSINTSITGATIPIGTIGKHSDTGESFQTTSATGVYFSTDKINIKSVGLGRQTNVSGKIIWQSPPSGLAPEATIIGTAIGGADIESDTDLQLRLQELLSDPPADGNTGAYLDLIRSSEHAVPVDQAFVIPAIVGPGSIGVTFTIRGNGIGRIPTAGHLSAVETYLKAHVPDDDCIFMLAINQQALAGSTPVVGVRFATGTEGFVDPDFFPKFDVPSGAGVWTISNITTPTPLQFSIRNATNTYVGSGIRNGQTIALWDSTNQKFVNKRILSFTGTGPFTITVDQSLNASDTVYAPGLGQRVSPWSTKLNDLKTEIVNYYNTLSPGEDVVSFPDPGNRQRRYPPDTADYPYTITTQMVSGIQSRSDILSVSVLSGLGSAPLASNSGGVFVNMIFLSDLAIYGTLCPILLNFKEILVLNPPTPILVQVLKKMILFIHLHQ
jgi:uncharacterized phage protein gp47/JayE